MALSFLTTRSHQIAIRSMITTVGGTIFVSVALLALTGPPLSLQPVMRAAMPSDSALATASAAFPIRAPEKARRSP